VKSVEQDAFHAVFSRLPLPSGFIISERKESATQKQTRAGARV
jgi:hypothetical protein